MLSNPSALIMALVTERPLSPYEMIRILEQLNVKRWLPISDSTVYTAVKNLERRELIKGRGMKEGNMPEKTIYSITAQGETALTETIKQNLASAMASNPGFDIAMLFLCHIARHEAIAILQDKANSLADELRINQDQLSLLQQNDQIPFMARMMVLHNRYLKEAELRTVQNLLIESINSERWDFQVAKDLNTK